MTGDIWPVKPRGPSKTTMRSQVVRPTSCSTSPSRAIAGPSGPMLLRPLDQDFDLAAHKGLVVLQADRVLNRQQLVIPPPLHLFGHVVRVQLEGPASPGRGLYLKMKLFLNRAQRTSSAVC